MRAEGSAPVKHSVNHVVNKTNSVLSVNHKVNVHNRVKIKLNVHNVANKKNHKSKKLVV
jgi:hypothetical protein